MMLDNGKKIRLDIIAVGLMMISLLMYQMTSFKIVPLILLCLGNAILHEISAVISVKVSNGKLSHNAIFVAGGSFGVATGQWLAEQNYSTLVCYISLAAIAIIIFFVSKQTSSYSKVPRFDLVNDKYGGNDAAQDNVLFFLFAHGGYVVTCSWCSMLRPALRVRRTILGQSGG